MRTTVFLLLFAVIMIGFGSVLSTPPTLANERAALKPTRFTSAYTRLTNCPSGLTKKEEKEAEANGSDIPSNCKGLGGYDVVVSYSACNSSFTLEKGDESISLGMQGVDWRQKVIEWRLAD